MWKREETTIISLRITYYICGITYFTVHSAINRAARRAAGLDEESQGVLPRDTIRYGIWQLRYVCRST